MLGGLLIPVVLLVLVLVLVTRGKQLKLGQVLKFGVEFEDTGLYRG